MILLMILQGIILIFIISISILFLGKQSQICKPRRQSTDYPIVYLSNNPESAQFGPCRRPQRVLAQLLPTNLKEQSHDPPLSLFRRSHYTVTSGFSLSARVLWLTQPRRKKTIFQALNCTNNERQIFIRMKGSRARARLNCFSYSASSILIFPSLAYTHTHTHTLYVQPYIQTYRSLSLRRMVFPKTSLCARASCVHIHCSFA